MTPSRDPSLSRPLPLAEAEPVALAMGEGGTGWFSSLDDTALLDRLLPEEARAVRERIGREMAAAVRMLDSLRMDSAKGTWKFGLASIFAL